jgi:hypothetical protein
MGHQHLGTLSRTRLWTDVVAMIGGGANLQDVVSATAIAAEQQMIDAADDPAVKHAVWLLTQIPLAAREKDFAAALRRLDIRIKDQPTLGELSSSLMQAVDHAVEQSGGRTDLGEMAQLSAVESLNAVAGPALSDFLEVPSERVKEVIGQLATVKHFAVLSREFFARLCRRQLTYFLSRELSQHVGYNSRFKTIYDHRAFEEAIDLHCRETSRIINDFSGQWFSLKLYEGGITKSKAGNFAYVAFGKIRAELHRRREEHA